MFKNKKVIVVMPAYNAEKTLLKTYHEVIEQEFVDQVIIVDDSSSDKTVKIASKLSNAKIITHKINKGYGANQKTCYRAALDEGGDIIIMVHPDYQYTPKLIPAMVSLIGNELYHCVLGSRILGGYAYKNGMPLWRYVSNRFLTFFENILMGAKLSEYHTGYRAFSRELLTKLRIEKNSDDFIFDNQILAQILWLEYPIAEISCPARYMPESSSISFFNSVKYGFGCIATSFSFRLTKMGLLKNRRFQKIQ